MASEIEIQRLMCAIRPTRVERLLNAAKVRSWGRSETGLFGWIGNRCDDLESWLRNQRAQWRAARCHAERARRRDRGGDE